MMAFGFRELANLLDKGQSLPEIAKLEAPLDAVSFFHQLPVRRLWLKELGLFASERRYPTATGSAGLADKSFGHVTCSSNQPSRAPRPANCQILRAHRAKLLDGPMITAAAAPGWIGWPISGPAPVTRIVLSVNFMRVPHIRHAPDACSDPRNRDRNERCPQDAGRVCSPILPPMQTAIPLRWSRSFPSSFSIRRR
jgi:hypothetical protein